LVAAKQDALALQRSDLIRRVSEVFAQNLRVMFTDIVRSTERAAGLGDHRWHELLSTYYDLLRKELSTFGGREVNTAGDGLLATFEVPRAPFDAPVRYARECARSDCRFAPGAYRRVRTNWRGHQWNRGSC
jgi:class 3 adenylate cyclase